ncbi:fasciclin domain-containing protein [Sphingobacterium cavernae]|uniref:fasciclin domain-containing protein n=1 Tax=Sphingobacterium cavernae TaxID=2592657 RepID=UPI00122FB6D7|nr:fasciclin domain-containing protein [Sphingobacterium cavernae]
MELNLLNFSKRFLAVSMVGLSSFLVSCTDDDIIVEENSSIVDVVVGSANFSTLESAVIKANLSSVLNGNGPFTVFAPDNEAFNASGVTSSVIQELSSDQLKEILLYHTLSSKVNSASIQTGSNIAVETANGDDVYVTKNSNGVFVNGWKVKQADIMASNGVIHSLERVLMPAAGNLVEVAQANANLSYLVAAVLRASQGTTNVAQVLTSAGPFTVFAPTNQAFINAGFPTIAAIEAADPNTLASILTYHVLSARAFSSDLTNGQSLTTVNGGTLSVALGTTATIKGKANTTASTITSVNIMASNGVVHLIDQVLLP